MLGVHQVRILMCAFNTVGFGVVAHTQPEYKGVTANKAASE